MVRPSGANGRRAVGIGKRVSGKVGPFLPLGLTQKRRVRTRLYGTVVSSVSNGVWLVRWDQGKEEACNSRALRGEEEVIVPSPPVDPIAAADTASDDAQEADRMSVANTLASLLAGAGEEEQAPSEEEPVMDEDGEEEEDIEDIIAMFTPPSAEEIRDAEPDTANGGVEFMEEDERVFPDVLPAAQPGRTNAEEQEDLNEDRGNYFTADDLGFTPEVAGGTEEDRDNYWSQRQAEAKAKIDSLVGEKITVKNHSAGCDYEWTVVGSESVQGEDSNEEYPCVGVRGIDWADRDLNMMDVLVKLWPGDWRKQLEQMNKMLLAAMSRSSRSKKGTVVKEVTEQEFWLFLALMLSACPFGKGGCSFLWSKSKRGVVPPPDFGKVFFRCLHQTIYLFPTIC
jgi:hypothetical protein